MNKNHTLYLIPLLIMSTSHHNLTAEQKKQIPEATQQTEVTVSQQNRASTAQEQREKNMQAAQIGDTVKVHYTGRFILDRSVFDSSQNKEPLQFTIGQNTVIPGFEQAIIGMQLNESKTVTIPAAQAYGPYRHELVYTINRKNLSSTLTPVVGEYLKRYDPKNETVASLLITEVKKDTITVNENHPLAGKDLEFDITLVEIS